MNRLVARAGAAMATVAGLAGCSSGEPLELSTPTAQVAINGKDTGSPQPVSCSQSGRAWIIETTDEDSGFTAMVGTEEAITAKSVEIRNLGGFTGSFWEGTVGKGTASIAGGLYTITGTAEGSYTESPTDTTTATFEIRTDC